MRLRLAWALPILAAIAICGSQMATATTPDSDADSAAKTAVKKHKYLGTAAVGDFLTITVNSAAQTISYSNLTNGESGTIPYTVNANGSYALHDPRGNLIAAYEVPGYALLIEADKAGPDKNTPALITAVESGPISTSTFANHSYNYMQFRTSFGGVDVGAVTIGKTEGQTSSYWPYGDLTDGSGGAFDSSKMDFAELKEDSSGTYLSGRVPGSGGGDIYVFGTSGGFFVVDAPNGSILGLEKAASKDFDPAFAGSYSSISYQKIDASMGQDNVETGKASLGQATIDISDEGAVKIVNARGEVVIQTRLIPISDASYLYGGAGELADPCDGLFTFRITTATSQEDVFVTFIDNAVVFSSFSASLPWSSKTGTYNYRYGVGLKQPKE